MSKLKDYILNKPKLKAVLKSLFKCFLTVKEFLFVNTVSLIFRRLPIDDTLIVYSFRGYSGSNLSFLFDDYAQARLARYTLINISDITNKSVTLMRIQRAFYLNRAKLLLSTHGPDINPKKGQVTFDLWHGFPIKGMNFMDKQDYKSATRSKKFNRILSLSTSFNTHFEACMHQGVGRYQVLGYPRNDYLLKSDGKYNLEKIIDKKLINKKIFLFMPTYRKSHGRTDDGLSKTDNFFGFNDFDMGAFLSYLKDNDILFILKLHPNEEAYYINKYKNLCTKHLLFLTSGMLDKNKIDLYKLVNVSDLLITDYSSVYFDYLLLDKPILFTPVDFLEYSANRGFLVEDYEFWSPGYKAVNFADFMNLSIKAINDDIYVGARKSLKNEVHRYQDGNSSIRVLDYIDTLIK